MLKGSLNPDNQIHGVRLLSLDGGGIRGLSELIILKEIMERIKCDNKLDKTPRPCEYFDLIGGTSTGGLIAIMLGRLGMSADEAITTYGPFTRRIFSKKKWKTQDGAFKATELETAIKEIIASKLGDAEERMMNPQRPTGCKTFVCAMSAINMSSPCLFRTYDVPQNPTYNCKIWEAARATSAAPTFFKRIFIGGEGMKEGFIDAGLGCNNPVAQVYGEAKMVFGEARRVACVVSLGAGHPQTIGLRKPDAFQRMLPTKLIDVLKGISTDCEAKAMEFEREHGVEDNVYFRFSVQQGLQGVSLAEWDRMSEVNKLTMGYLREMVVDREVGKLAEKLVQGRLLSSDG